MEGIRKRRKERKEGREGGTKGGSGRSQEENEEGRKEDGKERDLEAGHFTFLESMFNKYLQRKAI